MPKRGFAVVHVETTGLFPYRNDRILEIAVVLTDAAGRITGRWHTIVDPGPGSDKEPAEREDAPLAPTFDRVAPLLVELVSGRVLVFHDAQFGTSFLMSEFERMSYRPRRGMEAICTMQLAREFLPGAGRSLSDCCAAFDIEIEQDADALAQATATAQLFAAYVQSDPDLPVWTLALDRAAHTPWAPLESPRAAWVPRAVAPDSPTLSSPARSFLGRMVSRMPDYSGPDAHLDFLALLDRCLLNRRIDADNLRMLVQLAAFSGISVAVCTELTTSYVADLARVARKSGALCQADRGDLLGVAASLGVSASVVNSVIDPPPGDVGAGTVQLCEPVPLVRGDIVVLSGDLARSRADWHRELNARGFRVASAVTMRTRLLVVANPRASTGKSGKAVDYGIPMVSEFRLRSLIGVR
ncbi:exonuclease domain-containing protein [Cryobacterium sp. CG_9.6]|uniref:exonuclease domain-containing protein n=1 Tax=Cryobacterium sp. CG_9.6 TaxID=2760710 RepID=UPI0024749DA3|nr:exonuclease domain-containing protein [Cryobacterium sp. CG_9.6]MDH6237654.1 DNA polymerase-3 subunit epsilon [Cryobacterium sp. CG_9.6]